MADTTLKDKTILKFSLILFSVGFFGMPLIWVLNFAKHFNDAFLRCFWHGQRKLKLYCIISLIGSFIYFAGFIAWYSLFLTNRVKWGISAHPFTAGFTIGKA